MERTTVRDTGLPHPGWGREFSIRGIALGHCLVQVRGKESQE